MNIYMVREEKGHEETDFAVCADEVTWFLQDNALRMKILFSDRIVFNPISSCIRINENEKY